MSKKLKLYICEEFNGQDFTPAFLGAIAINKINACHIMLDTIKQHETKHVDFSNFGKITEYPLIEGISFYKSGCD